MKEERQIELYAQIGRIVGFPGPEPVSIRRHGRVVALVGMVATTFFVILSRMAFYGDWCEASSANEYQACRQLSSAIATVTCFAGFFSVSVLGVGLVEILTTQAWNEAKGGRALIVLVLTWVLFVSVLCLIINADFGV